MPKGQYTFISLHHHTLRREFLPDDQGTDISVGGSLTTIKTIHNFGLAKGLDFAGYGKPPIEVYESYEDIPEILPPGNFLVIEADVPMGRYWIPVIAIKTDDDDQLDKYRGQFCMHF
jgi:hypothetical protein